MTTMADIKAWAVQTLKNDAGFTQFCVNTVGSVLNFYSNSPADRVEEVLPFLTAFSYETAHDFASREDFSRTWSIPFAIGVYGDYNSVDDLGVTIWNAPDTAERLATEAVEVLRREAMSCGNDIQVLSYRILVTQIGEAEDVQANLFVIFGQMNTI